MQQQDNKAAYAKPLCGDEGCGCPTQVDLDAYQDRQWHDAGRAVAEMTGLHYDEQEGFRS